MYRVLKFILPLLLVLSACNKDNIPLDYLEGDWYYQYYNVHDVKLDGVPNGKGEEKTFEEPYSSGIRIKKSDEGYVFCFIPGAYYGPVFFPLSVEGKRLSSKDYSKIFSGIPIDVADEWQVVRLTPEIMEVKCDTYYNKYRFPATSGDQLDHYYEAHATLIMVKQGE